VRFATWSRTVARLVDGINNKCSIRAKHLAGSYDDPAGLGGDQTGFGMSTQTWSTPNRFASHSPSARMPNVSVA
jgi:hypothetical protein